MSKTINFKDKYGTLQTIEFNPETPITVSSEDLTELLITVTSPTYSTSIEYIGGRPKRD